MEQWAFKHMIFKKMVSRWTVNSIFNSCWHSLGDWVMVFLFLQEIEFLHHWLKEMNWLQCPSLRSAHMRAEIGAFKYKGEISLNLTLCTFIPLSQGRKAYIYNFIASFSLEPLTYYISEKISSAPFHTCLVPSGLLPLATFLIVHSNEMFFLSAFSLCLVLTSHSLILIWIHHLHFSPEVQYSLKIVVLKVVLWPGSISIL